MSLCGISLVFFLQKEIIKGDGLKRIIKEDGLIGMVNWA